MGSYFEKSGGIFLVSDPSRGIRFQVWPDSITDAKSVNWSMVDIVGRSEPIPVYHSSSSQEFGLTLMFVASVNQADNGTPQDVKQKVNFLKSLTYPQLSKLGFSTHPPLVYFIVGEAINARCVVKSVQVTLTGPWNIASDSTLSGVESYADLPISASVNITLATTHSAPLNHSQVLRLGDADRSSPTVQEIVFDF